MDRILERCSGLDVHKEILVATIRGIDLPKEIGIKVTLVNAKHIKNVPGKKTDVKYSEWLCDLLMHGLLKGSFIPPADIRDLRDLVRHRKKLIYEKTQEKNRVHKYLENSGVKISSVLTDILAKPE